MLWMFVEVQAGESLVLALSFVSHFLLLASYYILRPIRDDMGVAGGLDNLSWMFSATVGAMLVANTLFSALTTQYPRRRFIPLTYRFFAANLVGFFLLWKLAPPDWHIWVGRAFFVWVSVFNLFVISVYWGLITDTFNTAQSKRLFGFISVGGTLGAIAGSAVTATLVRSLGTANLLLVSAGLLEIAAQVVRRFPARVASTSDATTEAPTVDRPVGGSVWAGIAHEFRSPYLLGISAYMLLYSVTSTFLYFQQADLAAHHFADRAARTAFFAQLELLVNGLTVVAQVFLTARLLRWLGVGLTLALPPLISVVGFTALGFVPALGLFVVFQTVRRAANFAVSRPAREVLFTVLSREDKYKAKNFLDTFIYRVGDQVGAWSYPLVARLGLGFAGTSFVAAPLAGIWCAVSLWLGWRQLALTRASAVPSTDQSFDRKS